MIKLLSILKNVKIFEKGLKTVLVSVTLAFMIIASNETQNMTLDWVFYIYYLVQFQKKKSPGP